MKCATDALLDALARSSAQTLRRICGDNMPLS
jgi:hypothetical protein